MGGRPLIGFKASTFTKVLLTVLLVVGFNAASSYHFPDRVYKSGVNHISINLEEARATNFDSSFIRTQTLEAFLPWAFFSPEVIGWELDRRCSELFCGFQFAVSLVVFLFELALFGSIVWHLFHGTHSKRLLVSLGVIYVLVLVYGCYTVKAEVYDKMQNVRSALAILYSKNLTLPPGTEIDELTWATASETGVLNVNYVNPSDRREYYPVTIRFFNEPHVFSPANDIRETAARCTYPEYFQQISPALWRCDVDWAYGKTSVFFTFLDQDDSTIGAQVVAERESVENSGAGFMPFTLSIPTFLSHFR